ncbi:MULTISPECIES: enoyl-CoA hydratase/isomerase family protein [Mycolicibacter]|uniref:Enoyl-CoA hydratase/isomerase family protein n=1 Tax=[Mycobacterium] vasticus TaxID=2875777 RepID=A0ABU5YYD1_9MYCO|nr:MULTISPECIES: enoyl-CoA hydratase/isomerase family protein [unclassified Mycolicibacter]MEB3062501.1 enoyl-CoA hydratase/isomerase family protein [Mycolicibacter sp. MYC101]MEB3070151.1 enoyl-CoA hydratase/isomerase family protein [Mycolicibacter sp. MYC017]
MISVVDLDGEPDTEPGAGIVIATGSRFDPADPRLDRATFTLTERDDTDRRVIRVLSVPRALAEIEAHCRAHPHAAAICDDVLRAVDPTAPASAGVTTESLAYSTLQGGPEFARWLAERGPAEVPETPDPVLIDRDGDTLTLRFNRPGRHNAFSNAMRAGLLDGLAVARADTSISEVVLSGTGPSFCSGGDLAEFGRFTDVASAHLARTRYSPALALDALTSRLGARCRAEIHGQVLGSGLEMAAYCGRMTAHPDTVLGLPELSLGLVPGAGGTVSITRRIGRWRTGYLILSGRTIDARTALRWGLVDEVS